MNWEHLPKNAINNETIEQAIIRLIAEHNNNATSHMGEGQSIDVHRKNEIIDHKAGSVLNDKLSFNEIEYLSFFDSLTDFELGDGVTKGAYRQLQMIPVSNNSDTCTAYTEKSLFGTIINFTKDFLFQISFMINSPNDNIEFYAGFGAFGNGIFNGIGFVVKNGKLYASFNRDLENGTENFNQEISSFSFYSNYVLRFQYIAGERKLKFFINGILFAEYTVLQDINELMEEYLTNIKFKKNTNSFVVAYVSSIYWSRSI